MLLIDPHLVLCSLQIFLICFANDHDKTLYFIKGHMFVCIHWNQKKMEKGHAHINGCLHKSLFKICNRFNSHPQHWTKWLRYLSISCHSLEYCPILLFHIYDFKVIYMVLYYYLCTYEMTSFPLPKKRVTNCLFLHCGLSIVVPSHVQMLAFYFSPQILFFNFYRRF